MKTLYLGLNFENFDKKEKAYHYPIIKIVPKVKYLRRCLEDLPIVTHCIFTSPRSVSILCDYLLNADKLHFLKNKFIITIGKSTQRTLASYNINSTIPKISTQEGIIELLKSMPLENSLFFIPRSSIARKKIDHFFDRKRISYVTLDIYDTRINRKLKKIDLNDFEEVFFTSPSTVEAFFEIFKSIPTHLIFKAIGPVTKQVMEKHLM